MKKFIFTYCIFLALCTPLSLRAQTFTIYSIVLPSGGDVTAGGIYSNNAVIGEPVVGQSTSGTTRVRQGYIFTIDSVPTLTTDSVINDEATSATGRGIVTSDGGSPVTSCGVCWSTGSTPTINDNFSISATAGLGEFTSAMGGLQPNTKYYVRAFAVNDNGLGYGNVLFFTTTYMIPTLPEWGLIVMGGLIACLGGWWIIKRT